MSHRPENDPDQQLAEVDEPEPGSPDVVHADESPQASAPPRVDDPNDVGACPRHPNAPVIGGMCGGCTQYPTDMTELLGMVVETNPSIPPGTAELRPATSCPHRGPHPGFTCAEVDQTRPFWAGRWDEMDHSTYERLKQEWTARHANDPPGAAHVVEPPQPQQNTATVTALREQLAEAIGRTNLLIWPRHKRLAAADAVLALILPATRITAELARNADADVQRVIALYEQWVKAGAPPLGTSISRWWDQRLAELRGALLDDSPHTQPSSGSDALRTEIAQALTTEWYRRAGEQIVDSPEGHSAAMTDAVLKVVLPAIAQRERELKTVREARRRAEMAIARVRLIRKAPSRSPYNLQANAVDDGWDQALDAVHATLGTPERCETGNARKDHPVHELLAALKSGLPHPDPVDLIGRYYDSIHELCCPYDHSEPRPGHAAAANRAALNEPKEA